MKSKLNKGMLLVFLIMIPFVSFINSHYSQGSIVFGNLCPDDYFKYKIDYSNTYDNSSNYSGKFGIEISTIGSDNVFVICHNLVDEETQYRIIQPKRTIGNLPLGFDNPLNNIPSIVDILPNLFLVPINWSVNTQLFINSTYVYTEDVDIEYHAESSVVNHNLYLRKGLFREACIFIHNFKSNESAEEFTLEGEKVDGQVRAVYCKEYGYLIDLDVSLVGIETSNSLNLQIEITKSEYNYKTSTWGYISIISSIMGTPYLIGALVGSSIFLGEYIKTKIKSRKQQKIDEEQIKLEEEENRRIEEEMLKIKEKLPKDYVFIEKCPYCLADVPVNRKVCPECKGKK